MNITRVAAMSMNPVLALSNCMRLFSFSLLPRPARSALPRLPGELRMIA